MERVRQFFSAILAGMLIGGGNRVPFAVKSGSRQLFIRPSVYLPLWCFSCICLPGRLATRPSTSLCISLSWWSLGWGTLLAHGLQQQWYETAVFMREWLNGLRAWLKWSCQMISQVFFCLRSSAACWCLLRWIAFAMCRAQPCGLLVFSFPLWYLSWAASSTLSRICSISAYPEHGAHIALLPFWWWHWGMPSAECWFRFI